MLDHLGSVERKVSRGRQRSPGWRTLHTSDANPEVGMGFTFPSTWQVLQVLKRLRFSPQAQDAPKEVCSPSA